MEHFRQVNTTLSDERPVKWIIFGSVTEARVKVKVGDGKRNIFSIPKGMSSKADVTRANFEDWLEGKLGVVVAAETPEVSRDADGASTSASMRAVVETEARHAREAEVATVRDDGFPDFRRQILELEQ
jgi:hypothetical protein